MYYNYNGGLSIAYEILLIMLGSLTLGLIRGTSICATVCAPGMVSYIAVKKYSVRESVRLGLIFNLPRIIILTAVGGIAGYIVFILKTKLSDMIDLGRVMGLGYVLLGFFLLAFGAYWFAKSMESREDRKEGNPKPPDLCKVGAQAKKHGWIFNKISNKLTNPKTQPTTLFLIWGGILSIACLGEIIIIEGAVISGAAASFGSEALGAIALGSTGMFMFAIGATVPVIVVTIIGSSLPKYLKTAEKLEAVKTIGAIMMIMIGLVFILISIGGLIG